MGTILDKKGNKYTLYQHQQDIVDKFPKRTLLSWQVRTGKTLASIYLANRANCHALIVVPKKLTRQWEDELKKHATFNWTILTKEQFRRDAKTLPKYNTIICDEAHHFAGIKSKLSKYMKGYVKKHNVEHIYLLTGTAYRSSPWNIYTLASILGYEWNYMDFRNKYFNERYLGTRVVHEPRKDCQEELGELVRSIGSVVRLEDCMDMPQNIVQTEEIEETKEQKDLKEHVKMNETNPLTRLTKLHQVASGLLIGDEFTPTQEVKCNKDNRILELVEEFDRIIIFCRFRKQIERYRQLLHTHNLECVTIEGATKDPHEQREKARNIKRGATIISAGCAEGYDLSGYSVAVYASLSYGLLDYEQSRGRIQNIEKKTPNLYLILNTKKSMDEAVWNSIKNKRSFSEAIYLKENNHEST